MPSTITLAKRKYLQDIINSLDLEITFYNIFAKGNTSKKTDHEKYMVCLGSTKDRRDAAIRHLRTNGYICKPGAVYINEDRLLGGAYAGYSFKIDLESVKLT